MSEAGRQYIPRNISSDAVTLSLGMREHFRATLEPPYCLGNSKYVQYLTCVKLLNNSVRACAELPKLV